MPAVGTSRGGRTTKLHLVAADAADGFALSPDNAHDAPEGWALLEAQGPMAEWLPLLMDRAYEDDQTRRLARRLGIEPASAAEAQPARTLGLGPRAVQKRNQIERLFRRLKAYRRVFTRFDKLDLMYLGFVCFALILEALR